MFVKVAYFYTGKKKLVKKSINTTLALGWLAPVVLKALSLNLSPFEAPTGNQLHSNHQPHPRRGRRGQTKPSHQSASVAENRVSSCPPPVRRQSRRGAILWRRRRHCLPRVASLEDSLSPPSHPRRRAFEYNLESKAEVAGKQSFLEENLPSARQTLATSASSAATTSSSVVAPRGSSIDGERESSRTGDTGRKKAREEGPSVSRSRCDSAAPALLLSRKLPNRLHR